MTASFTAEQQREYIPPVCRECGGPTQQQWCEVMHLCELRPHYMPTVRFCSFRACDNP